MQTFCPKCGTKLSADESLVGQQVQCGKCGNLFTVVPLAISPPAPEEPEQPPTPPVGGEPPETGETGSEEGESTEGPSQKPISIPAESLRKSLPGPPKGAAPTVKCPKCSSDVPAEAALCTNCGTFLKQPVAGPAKKSRLAVILALVGVLVVAIGAIWYWHATHAAQTATAPPPPPPKPVANVPEAPTPARSSLNLAKVELTPITAEEIAAMGRLPAEDPPVSEGDPDALVPKSDPLALQPTLTQTVDLKGPLHDRHQPAKPPQISPQTRLVTLHCRWRTEPLDQRVPINAETLHVTTDAGPGVLYGVEFAKYVSPTNWMPYGATANSSSVLESVQLVRRRASDWTIDMLASGALLARPAYTNWFAQVDLPAPRDGLLQVLALNQFMKPGKDPRVETEVGSFFSPDSQFDVHLLVPAAVRWVRIQLGDQGPQWIPLEAISTIPTTSQPDPMPFIQSMMEKARVLLAASAPEEVIAGARLLTETGNLDRQNRMPAKAFGPWADSVTQLLAHADMQCRAAAVDTIFRSQHVDPKLRLRLLEGAIQNKSAAVRRRAAQLLTDGPSLLEQAASFKESMQVLEGLVTDSNASVRAAAGISNYRMAVFGDDNTFEGQFDLIQKGLKDPAPSVRFALLNALPALQAENEKTTLLRLAHILKYVRLNLFDSSDAVRLRAAQTILEIRSPTSTEIVRDALQQIPDKTAESFARASFEVAVGNRADLPKRVPALADKGVQGLLLPTLTKFLDDPSPRVRESATRVLALFDPAVANGVLASAITNSEAGVRLSLLSSWNDPGRTGAPPAAVFAPGLQDADLRVRGAVFGLLDRVLVEPAVASEVSSSIEANVSSTAMRQAVAQKMAGPALTNATALLATTSFLADKDDAVWRAAITPWTRTTLRLPWQDAEPAFQMLNQQASVSRRLGAFWPLRLATAETPKSASAGPAKPAPEAVDAGGKLLGDPEPLIRESALLYVTPLRTASMLDAIRKILTDPKSDLPAGIRNPVLVALAQPSPSEEFRVMDRIRSATEDDKKKEINALIAAGHTTPPKPNPRPKTGEKPAPAAPPTVRAAFSPIDYQVLVPTTSLSGICLLTEWATSGNASSEAAARYLVQFVPSTHARTWLLPSERVALEQALHKLEALPSVAASARAVLGPFQARFPRDAEAHGLGPEQTQGAAASIESLAAFLTPKKRQMTVATYKNPVGILIDIWYGADQTILKTYPPDLPATSTAAGGPWKLEPSASLQGARIEPLNREILARLEWALANAPGDNLRDALLQVSKTEGDLAVLSRRVAMEGLVLLAEKGDTKAEADAIQLGWLKP